ncbi:MAG: PspA/IM30 family protein [Synechococcus sp. SB0665_bin_28]|nr:PspA/IM30 family protein [Synechococcus sp. SB0665_bin_28]MYF20445.1 PspA/IM30 family protein [Synechococcus sp. SB0677_bin_5]
MILGRLRKSANLPSGMPSNREEVVHGVDFRGPVDFFMRGDGGFSDVIVSEPGSQVKVQGPAPRIGRAAALKAGQKNLWPSLLPKPCRRFQHDKLWCAKLTLLLVVSMPFISRLSRVFRANANALVSSTEEPARILDQALMDMQGELVALRQAVAVAVANQKRIETELQQARDQAAHWHDRAYTVLQQGKEGLAREALARCKPYEESAQDIRRQLESQALQVEELKRNLLTLESRVAQAQARRGVLKARIQSVRARKNVGWDDVSGTTADSAMDAFERMEEKVEVMEAGTAPTSHSFPALSRDWESVDLEGRFQELKARLRSSTSGNTPKKE